jgi:OmpA-OmpF porin, OOP family
MTRTKKLLAAIAAWAACSPALAQDTGFYAGAALGQSSYREGCADFNRVAGTGGTAFTCTREDTAGKLFAGWRFLRYLAAEVSYIDYGEAKATSAVAGAPATGTTKVKAAGISALGILPVGERFSILGRLGLLQVNTRTQVSGAVSGLEDDDETEMHVGIGALYQFSGGWGMRVEYERLNDTKIDLFSLGVQYRF